MVVGIGLWWLMWATPVKIGELKFLSQYTIGAGVTQGEAVMGQQADATISSAAALDGRGRDGVELRAPGRCNAGSRVYGAFV